MAGKTVEGLIPSPTAINKKRKKTMYHKTHRPKHFKEIIGKANKIVANTIETFIDNGTLSHTLLFSGIRGVGKTTIGKLIAEKLGCTTENVNVFELNTSSDRGINKARDIIKNAVYKPHIGDKKVYILDEVHQVTPEFSEAMLQITQDTPDHVYFILCTSKPEELDDALLSRCEKYVMNPCNSREIANLLNRICKEEKLEVSKKVINYISANSDGVPREALVSLHQVSNLNEDEALTLLQEDVIDENVFINLVNALWKKKPWKATRNLVKKCSKKPEVTRHGVLSYVSTCLINSDKVDPQLMLIFDTFSQSFKKSGREGYNGLIFACAVCLEGV